MHITMKTSPHALHLLRLVATATDETQACVMERLLAGEARRLNLIERRKARRNAHAKKGARA